MDWRAALEQGKQALTAQHYQDALDRFRATEQGARSGKDDAGTIECLRLEAAAARELGDFAAMLCKRRAFAASQSSAIFPKVRGSGST